MNLILAQLWFFLRFDVAPKYNVSFRFEFSGDPINIIKN